MLERFLAWSANRVIRREHPTVIAVTGSVGKSSTKDAIGLALGASYKQEEIRATYKNYNNELGVPLTILGCLAPGRSLWKWIILLWNGFAFGFGLKRTRINIFALEMGADHPGDLAYLVKIAPPFIAVVSAVTPYGADIAPVHTANYRSIQAVADEKATIVKALPADGTAILNMDDPLVSSMRSLTKAKVYTFGRSEDANVRIVETRIATQAGQYGRVPQGLKTRILSYNHLLEVYLPGVFGSANAYALAAAFIVSMVLDEGLIDEIAAHIGSHFRPPPGRSRIISGIKHTTLFDGSYNASPSSVISSLRDLASLELDQSQRRVACLGEMRELGTDAETLHERIGTEVARLRLDFFVACGTMARAMARGAREHGMKEEQIKIFDDTPEAGLFLQDWIYPGDIILAKASEGSLHDKGVRMERVIKELMAEPQRAKELLVRQESAWLRK